MSEVSAVFRLFDPAPSGAALTVWRDWFTTLGVDPDTVAFAGPPSCPITWVERRAHPGQNEVVHLVAAVRDGEPIVQERTVVLTGPPPPFPTG